MFFEHNRAHMAVFRDTAGRYARHHFEVSGDSVAVWDTWLEPDSLLLRGVWSGDTMRMQEATALLELIRIARPGERP